MDSSNCHSGVYGAQAEGHPESILFFGFFGFLFLATALFHRAG